ncbi:hypothetical protein Mal64_36290 [Pseudobythopirellula maris]|uniref:Uncharacterized protein n=1 Tax=Pseudobythopirellula maris TaxID=2527991 RepID=A0A5C5ZHB2_9BACT|nr:hypothetical protein [Pseudobythopirellula maris]TWT86799.1 hypothetical protein Mal64_36290 [Pseudobythopirellula maris]
MAKKNRNAPHAGAPHDPKESPNKKSADGLSLWLRVLLSLLIVWHLFVVFISPFSVSPSSDLAATLAQTPLVRWYSDPLYLNNGYHFFGPEPPVNHLVWYRVLDDAGETVTEGEFPNLKQQWPRLLYHRHMMLADQAAIPPGPQDFNERLRLSLRSYAKRILRVHGGSQVRVAYVRHDPLLPEHVREGADAYAESTYQIVFELTEYASDLDEPLFEPDDARAPEPLPPGALPAGDQTIGGAR